jgi:predicted RNA-binding Zn-ribbon protein involved in translation (DUF1610 family)
MRRHQPEHGHRGPLSGHAGYRTDGGCGAVIDFANPIALATVFRCVECGRWMHKRCILAHFEESRHDALTEVPA